MKRVLLVTFAALAGQPDVASAENISIAIRAFIPAEHPGIPGYMVPVKGDPSHTTLPDAPVGQCFGTDNRSFSNEGNASSRFGGLITVDVSAGSAPTLSLIKGITKEYDCDTGKIVCEKTAGAGGFKIDNITVSRNIISFTYKGEASNPCLRVAPDIEFTGTVRIDRSARTVSIDGKNDVFPSFEAVLFTVSGAKSLFRIEPEGQSTPADLLTSSADRPVSATKSY